MSLKVGEELREVAEDGNRYVLVRLERDGKGRIFQECFSLVLVKLEEKREVFGVL